MPPFPILRISNWSWNDMKSDWNAEGFRCKQCKIMFVGNRGDWSRRNTWPLKGSREFAKILVCSTETWYIRAVLYPSPLAFNSFFLPWSSLCQAIKRSVSISEPPTREDLHLLISFIVLTIFLVASVYGKTTAWKSLRTTKEIVQPPPMSLFLTTNVWLAMLQRIKSPWTHTTRT